MFDSIFSHCDDKDIDEFIKEKEIIQGSLNYINLLVRKKLLHFHKNISLTRKNCSI